MEEYFVIPHKNLDPEIRRVDPDIELFLLEYCDERLKIPLFLVHFVYMSGEGLEIVLRRVEDWMIGELWYLNLFDLSTHAEFDGAVSCLKVA